MLGKTRSRGAATTVYTLLALLLSSSIALAQFGVGAQEDRNLLGTWKGTIEGQEVVIVFSSGGSMTFMGYQAQYSVPRTNTLVITLEGESFEYQYQISGNTMQVTGEDIEGVQVLTRIGGGGGGGNLDAQQLVGTWTASVQGQEFSIIFGADGSMRMGDEQWRYNTQGGMLNVDTGQGVVSYNTTLSGNSLTLSGGDLQVPVTFIRQGGAPVVEQPEEEPDTPFARIRRQQQQQDNNTQDPNIGGDVVAGSALPRTLAGVTLMQGFTPPATAQQQTDQRGYNSYAYEAPDGSFMIVTVSQSNQVLEVAQMSSGVQFTQAQQIKDNYVSNYRNLLANQKEGANDFEFTFADSNTVIIARYNAQGFLLALIERSILSDN